MNLGVTVHCPRCGGSSLSAANKGFGGAQALAGAVLLGPLGLAAGFLGSGAVQIVCLSCGARVKPGSLVVLPAPQAPREPTEEELRDARQLTETLQRLDMEDAEKERREREAHDADVTEILKDKGYSDSDLAFFGRDALAGPELAELRRQREEKAEAERLEAQQAREAERRAKAIAEGFDPDAVPFIVPVRTETRADRGLFRWPWEKKRP